MFPQSLGISLIENALIIPGPEGSIVCSAAHSCLSAPFPRARPQARRSLGFTSVFEGFTWSRAGRFRGLGSTPGPLGLSRGLKVSSDPGLSPSEKRADGEVTELAHCTFLKEISRSGIQLPPRASEGCFKHSDEGLGPDAPLGAKVHRGRGRIRTVLRYFCHNLDRR